MKNVLIKNSYTTTQTAKRGAERADVTYGTRKARKGVDGKFSFPLYNWDSRVRSEIKSPVKAVWDLCFEFGENVSRANIVQMAVNMGIASNTAKTQYYRWAKASKQS